MLVPERVVRETRSHWGMDARREEEIGVAELDHDWVVWRRADEGRAGGLRLVVPKFGTNAFEIPSYCGASAEGGVSSEYELVVESPMSGE